MTTASTESIPEQFGRYRIVKPLGRGGMGSVFLAEDTKLQRRVALKIPHFDGRPDPDVLARFYREARSLAAIQHPNICPLHDVGEHEGTPFLTMAFIEGEPLSDILAGAKMNARSAATLVRTLALALAETHRHGIVHRDLKPENIMLDRRRRPVLMDFGLARRRNAPDSRVTQTGMIIGTPAYMSPEQIRGEVDAIGPASDIYSLGVILYELLTGTKPFDGSGLEVLSQVLNEEPQRVAVKRPNIAPQLDAICHRAMAKSIEDRFPTMASFAEAIGQYLGKTGDGDARSPRVAAANEGPGSTVVETEAGPGQTVAWPNATQPITSSKRRTPAWLWGGIGAGCLALIAIVWSIAGRGNGTDEGNGDPTSPPDKPSGVVTNGAGEKTKTRPEPGRKSAGEKKVVKRHQPDPPPPLKPAPQIVRFAVLPLPKPVTSYAMNEDGRLLAASHLEEDKVTIWDLLREKVAATIPTPTPRTMLFRGSSLIVANEAEGAISVFAEDRGWKRTDRVKLPKSRVYHLSAARGEHYKRELLATCHGPGATGSYRGSSVFYVKLDGSIVRSVSGAAMAGVSADGQLVLTQASFRLSPSGTISAFNWKDFIAGAKVKPVYRAGLLQTPFVYQVRAGHFWISRAIVFGERPLRTIRDNLGRFLIPDLAKPAVYSLTPTKLTGYELGKEITKLDSRQVELPPFQSKNFDRIYHDIYRIRDYLLDHPVAYTREGVLSLIVMDIKSRVLLFARTSAIVGKD